jgi:hypothetical protein
MVQVDTCNCHTARTHRRLCPGNAGWRGRKPCNVIPDSSLLPPAVGIWREGTTTVVVSATCGGLLYLYHQYSKASVMQARPIPTNMTINTPPMTKELPKKKGYVLWKTNSYEVRSLRNSLASFQHLSYSTSRDLISILFV